MTWFITFQIFKNQSISEIKRKRPIVNVGTLAISIVTHLQFNFRVSQMVSNLFSKLCMS
uniref:Uncharacterized protein n=1 Tax=Arundo donax TaxID=35708 RepID=A0A0A8YMC8_ARUDO